MKHFKLYLTALLFAALGFTSCTMSSTLRHSQVR